MTYQTAVLMLSIIVSFAGPGCKASKPASDPGDAVVVTVNETPITEAEIAVKLQQMGSHGREAGPEMRERAIEEIIVQELMYQKGQKLGLDKEVKFRNSVRLMELRNNEFKRAEMERQIRNTQVAAKVEVNDDVKKLRRAWGDDLDRLPPAQYAEDEARSSLEQIKSGTPFDTVAKEKSPSAPKGKTAPWDMGYLHWNQIPIEWVDAVYALKKDEVSGVLSSKRSGVFIVKIFDRKKNPDAAFGRMSASIMNRLRDLRVMQDYDRYIDALKSEAKIVKHEERRKAS
jgi:parvulin-like peptidyl-prolyl isomerase